MTLEKVIEALLFSAQKPLSIREIATAIKAAEDDLASETPNEFARVKDAEVAAALQQLKLEYIEQGRAFQLVEKAEGWQVATDPAFAKWVRQLFPAPKPARLSAPALETLAIIAYRQPITRADVEARSEEHTSELQSQSNIVCRLLLAKKNHNKQRQL